MHILREHLTCDASSSVPLPHGLIPSLFRANPTNTRGGLSPRITCADSVEVLHNTQYIRVLSGIYWGRNSVVGAMTGMSLHVRVH